MGHHDDRQWDERVVDYIYGELEPADAARFEAEMALRPELAAEVRELQAVARLAAADADPIPEPPETAITEALTAARARCDELRETSPGLWEQISAWLLTPQLAGVLTLVLIISVGIYTVGTGVFRRDTADEPSMRHEMAPVEPAAEAEVRTKEKAKTEAKANGVPIDKGTITRADEDNVPLAPAAPEGAAAQAPAPEPVDQALPDAWITDREDRVKEKITEQPRVRATNQRLRSLMDDLTTTENLDAALAAEEPLSEDADSDTRSMDTPARPKTVDARGGVSGGGVSDETVSGGTGNFAGKAMSKPKVAGAAKAAEKKKTVARRKKVQSKEMMKKKEDKKKGEKKSSKVAPLLRKIEEEAPPPESTGKKGAGWDDRQTEMRHAPTKSLLDGIVVPPDAGPAKKQPAPAPVVLSTESVKVLSAVPQVDGGEDDGFLDTASAGNAPTSGQFSSTTMNEDKSDKVTAVAEPDYMIRPEAAEAPGISLGSMERAEKDESEEIKKETGEAEEKAPASSYRLGGAAAVCAALAKALEEAEDAEDWPLAEKLTQQMIAQGCVADRDLDAVQEQRSRYKLKAVETDTQDPAQEEAPAEAIPATKKAAEPVQKK